MSTTEISAADVKRAISALDRAWNALAPLQGDEANDSVVVLRSDIRQYLEYLEHAQWWRRTGCGSSRATADNGPNVN